MTTGTPGSFGERAAELARAFDASFAEPETRRAESNDEYLAIRSAGEPYAIRLEHVASLSAGRKIVALPSVSSALRGVVSIRAAVLPAYDLAALLGGPYAAAPRWVVVASALPVAFAFEELEGHLRLTADAVAPQAGGEGESSLLRGLIRAGQSGGQPRPIVHLPALLDVIRKLVQRNVIAKEP